MNNKIKKLIFTIILFIPFCVIKANTNVHFNDSTETEIPISHINEPIDNINVSDNIEGGSNPYMFQKVSGPDWISVGSSGGIISGTPTGTGENEDLVVRVIDDNGNTDDITLTVGETLANGIAIKDVNITFNDEIGLSRIDALKSITVKDSLGKVISAYLYDENEETNEFEKIQEGHEYSIDITLEAPDGYYYDNDLTWEAPLEFYVFGSKVTGKINSIEAYTQVLSDSNVSNTNEKDSGNGKRLLLLMNFTANNIKNPETNDDIAKYIIIGLISLIGLATTSLFLKKKFN